MAKTGLIIAGVGVVALGAWVLTQRKASASGNGDDGGNGDEPFVEPPGNDPIPPGDEPDRPDTPYFLPPPPLVVEDPNAVFGPGTDGKVVATSGMVLSRDMHYTELGVPNGVSVRTNGHRIFASIAVFNFGTIQNDGEDGHEMPGDSLGGKAAPSGDIGGYGGNGGNGGGPWSNVQEDGYDGSPTELPINAAKGGHGGSGDGPSSMLGVGAGGNGSGDTSGSDQVRTVADLKTLRLSAGGGGGGGGTSPDRAGAGGGGGGGIALVAARYLDNELGRITVNGGRGGDEKANSSDDAPGGVGGGGGGGTLVLIYGSRLVGVESTSGGSQGGWFHTSAFPRTGAPKGDPQPGNRGTVIRVSTV